MKFLDKIYKIDVEIPTQILRFPKTFNFRYETAYHRWRRACFSALGDKMEFYPAGGLNALVDDRDDNFCAFWVVELCGLHSGLNNRHNTIECTISICDTAAGYALNKWIENGKVEEGKPKTRYFVRGSVILDSNGNMEDIEFESVTAIAYGIANYETALSEIFNPNIIGYCDDDVKDKIKDGQFTL